MVTRLKIQFANFFLILLFFMLFGMVTASQAMRVDRTKDELFLESGQELDFEAKLWRAIQEQPYNPDNWEVLGLFYDYVGDFEKFLEALQNQVAYLSEEAENKDVVYGNLARAYMLNDMGKHAGEWLQKADEINFHNHFNRWNSFWYHTEFEFDASKAARDLSVLDEMGNSETDWFYDGLLRLIDSSSLDVDSQVEVFEEALRQNPNNHKVLRTLAAALRLQALENPLLFERVYELLEQSISLAPDFFPTYLTMANARLFENLGDMAAAKEQALVWVEKARMAAPEDPRPEYTEANYHLMTKDYALAIASFQKAIDKGMDKDDLRDELSLAYNDYAYALYLSGKDYEKALDLVNEALKWEPGHGVILSTRAELLYKLGRYDEAWEDIQESIRQFPDHEVINKNYDMIKSALENRDFERAK